MKQNWQIKKLGEVCNIIGGTTPSTTNKSYWNGTEKWITPAEIDINKKYIFDSVRHITTQAVKDCSLQLQPKGTVIFTSRAPIGKVAISEMDFYCNQGFKNFVCSEEIFNEYLYYFLLKNVDYLNSIGKGTTFKEISKTVISQVQIPLPSLEEQKRIVTVLDKKFAQIETLKTAAEKNLQNTKQLFQAELEKAFSNTSWEKKRLSDVCLQKQNKKWKDENNNTEYQYIDLSAVDRETNAITETQIITKKTAPSRAQQIVKTGDVLFGTTRPTLKRVCLLSDEYDEQICSTGFCIIRANNKEVTPDWLYYQFFNDAFYKYIEPLQKGASYPAVTDKEVLNYEIPLPPLEEQKRIVAHLDSLSEKVHQLEEIYTKQLTDCDELKQSLLQKAFEGEL